MSSDTEITAEVLAAAERLAGLELTDAERKLVIESIRVPLAAYERRRKVPLPPELGPAVRFDPRLPGTDLTDVRPGLVRSTRDPGPLPVRDADIAFAPVTALSRWIERKELSSAALTEVYLERLSRVGPKLECVISSSPERARAQAARADSEIRAGRSRGPLHGIPWGAKDILDTAGIATTWGATPYRNRVPERDAEVVRRLEAAGAVLVAKLSLGELAMGDVWFGGRTRNPWDLEQGSGGSSAGPAAAVAAGLVGFSIGSETLGSITSPSATCGAVGLRPTFGRVPRTGAMVLCWSLDKLGPICRGAEDTALVLAAIQGPHDGDPDSIDLPFGFDATASLDGRRVGYIPDWFEANGVSEPERAALGALSRAGLTLESVSLPDLPYETLFTSLWVEAAAAFDELTRTGIDDELRQQDARAWPNIFRTARFVPAVEYVQLQRLRRRSMEAMRDAFHGVDAIVAPGIGHTLLLASNATGHPSLTLPVGFREDGTPAAITLHGRLFDEGTLCRIGIALESELGLGDLRPPVD